MSAQARGVEPSAFISGVFAKALVPSGLSHQEESEVGRDRQKASHYYTHSTHTGR